MLTLKTIVTMLLSLALALLLTPLIPQAASRTTEELADLIRMAEAVVEIEVLAQDQHSDARSGLPLTLTTARVRSSYKGTLSQGEQIVIETFGGKTGEQIVFAPGQARFEVNMIAVTALIAHPVEKGRYRVLGGDVGQIVIVPDANGKRIARRMWNQFSYYAADRESLTGYRAIRSQAIAAATMDELVKTIIATGKPVLEKPAQVPAASAALPQAVSAPQVLAVEPTGASLAYRVFIILGLTTLAWITIRRLR
ncbi:MAG TPA: hypothetical protein VEK08_17875 [Planctomycetota bacterium]|nr:hypothetical protein [Planctomycetota bacterium]